MSDKNGDEAGATPEEAPPMNEAISQKNPLSSPPFPPPAPPPPPSPSSPSSSPSSPALIPLTILETSSPETSTELARFAPQGFTAIGPIGGERKARDWSLVLQSIEIWHVVHRTFAGWVLLVRDVDYDRASASIDRYEVENRDWPPRPPKERPRYPETRVAAVLFIALVAFFLITGPVAGGSRWFQQGKAVSDLVLTSEPWRAVTALTLHADSAHALGNMISGTIFASAVCSRLGPGGGALAVLASGIFGNVANAVYHQSIGNGGHGSIGASTAVFGAVGLLAATQIAVDHVSSESVNRSLVERVAPFVGGFALLGALGASPNSDLGAHLFGFLAGGLIGLAVAWPLRKKAKLGPWWLQASLGAVAAGVVIGSWQLAIRH